MNTFETERAAIQKNISALQTNINSIQAYLDKFRKGHLFLKPIPYYWSGDIISHFEQKRSFVLEQIETHITETNEELRILREKLNEARQIALTKYGIAT